MGGAERQALLLAKLLKHNYQCEITFFSLGQDDVVSSYCENLGFKTLIKTLNWSQNSLLRQIKAIIKFIIFLRKLKPDIILPYTHLPNILCNLTWRFTSAIFCCWNQRNSTSFNIYLLWEKFAVKNSSVILTNSANVRDKLMNENLFASKKIYYIRNGIDISSYIFDDLIWQTNLRENSLKICMIANLHDNKDHFTLLKSWKRIIDQVGNLDIQLLLAGRKGSTYNSLNRYIFVNQMVDSVVFLGSVKNIEILLSQVDICVFSSVHVHDSAPNGILECMAAGLPVVASNIKEIKEIFDNKEFNLFFNTGDDADLAEKLLIMIKDERLRSESGVYNKKLIERYYLPDILLENMVKIILKYSK